MKVNHRKVSVIRRSDLARLTGCNLETIRYYENVGVMPEPPRTSKNYRTYDDTHVARLRFVMRSRAGFHVGGNSRLARACRPQGRDVRRRANSCKSSHWCGSRKNYRPSTYRKGAFQNRFPMYWRRSARMCGDRRTDRSG